MMTKANQRTIGLIFTHVLLWCLLGFVLFVYPPLTWNVRLPAVFWVRHLYLIGSLGVVFYLNSLWFTPKLLFRDKRILFLVWILTAILIEQCFSVLLDNRLHFSEIMAQFGRHRPKREDLFDEFMLMMTLLALGISTSVAVVKQWQQDARLKDELQKQQIASELAFLKAQINPHFFFNTLNTIYALSYTDVDLSREALHKLSRMMRYLLYEIPQHETTLSQEIKFIKDHIELMKLRLNANNEVIFHEPILERDLHIAPMLLLPFVENAFKHGISTKNPSKILVDIEVDERNLRLRVSNTLQENNPSNLEGNGIGLQNTKRRLNLLYPNKHRLMIKKDMQEGLYQVELTLTLV